MNISIANFKGGVGKTSIASNLGAYLFMKGSNVLLVDLDAQANLSQVFESQADEGEACVYDLLQGADFDEVVKTVRESGKYRIDLLPSSVRLALAEGKLAIDYGQKGAVNRMDEALKKYQKEYDHIIFDCSPSIGILTQNAFKISDYVLIPTLAEPLALRGIGTMQDAVSLFHQSGLNKNLEIGGFIKSRLDTRATLYRSILQSLEDTYPDLLFKNGIGVSVAIAESQAMKQTIFEYDQDMETVSKGGRDMMNLFDEISEKLGL